MEQVNRHESLRGFGLDLPGRAGAAGPRGLFSLTETADGYVYSGQPDNILAGNGFGPPGLLAVSHVDGSAGTIRKVLSPSV